MKTIIALLGCSALIAGFSSTAVYASDADSSSASKFAAGLGVGTTGLTLEAQYALNDRIALRGNFNYLSLSIDEEFDDIDYEGDLDLTTFGGFIDYAPFKNGFILSAGAFLGDKTLDLDGTPSTAVEIGGQIFQPSEVGTLTGQAELNSFAPYLGIGYDSFIAGSKNWTFNARAGVMFTGSPEVELVSANGTLSSDPTLRQEIEAEIASIEEEADDFKYYPVVSIGFARRF